METTPEENLGTPQQPNSPLLFSASDTPSQEDSVSEQDQNESPDKEDKPSTKGKGRANKNPQVNNRGRPSPRHPQFQLRNSSSESILRANEPDFYVSPLQQAVMESRIRKDTPHPGRAPVDREPNTAARNLMPMLCEAASISGKTLKPARVTPTFVSYNVVSNGQELPTSPVKRRPGRPRGSKNRPKGSVSPAHAHRRTRQTVSSADPLKVDGKNRKAGSKGGNNDQDDGEQGIHETNQPHPESHPDHGMDHNSDREGGVELSDAVHARRRRNGKKRIESLVGRVILNCRQSLGENPSTSSNPVRSSRHGVSHRKENPDVPTSPTLLCSPIDQTRVSGHDDSGNRTEAAETRSHLCESIALGLNGRGDTQNGTAAFQPLMPHVKTTDPPIGRIIVQYAECTCKRCDHANFPFCVSKFCTKEYYMLQRCARLYGAETPISLPACYLCMECVDLPSECHRVTHQSTWGAAIVLPEGRS